MNNLDKINTIKKTGDEQLVFKEKYLSFRLKDFWIWSVSDILSNATRGRFAEFIVATATGIDLKIPRDEWAAYDLITHENIKLEIKSAAFIQSWKQDKYSSISFSIKPARYWDSETNKQSTIAKRHADVYVMCLLKHKDQSTINPLDLSQWTFYILSTYELDNYERSQSSITLNSLERLTNPVGYDKIYAEVRTKNKLNK